MSPEPSPALTFEVDLQHRLGPLRPRRQYPHQRFHGPSSSEPRAAARAPCSAPSPAYSNPIGAASSCAAKTVLDSAANQRTFLPPHKRPMRFAPQRALLFPRKTVRLADAGRQGIACRPAWVDEWAMRCTIRAAGVLLHHLPQQLSGGQRQTNRRRSAPPVGVASGTAPGHPPPRRTLHRPRRPHPRPAHPPAPRLAGRHPRPQRHPRHRRSLPPRTPKSSASPKAASSPRAQPPKSSAKSVNACLESSRARHPERSGAAAQSKNPDATPPRDDRSNHSAANARAPPSQAKSTHRNRCTGNRASRPDLTSLD